MLPTLPPHCDPLSPQAAERTKGASPQAQVYPFSINIRLLQPEPSQQKPLLSVVGAAGSGLLVFSGEKFAGKKLTGK